MPGPGGQPTTNRSTFRPPWVKDGPPPIPMPTAPWALNQRRDSKTPTDDAPAFTKVRLKSVPKPADLRDPSASPEPESPPKAVSKITINMSQSKADKSPSPQPPSPSSLKSRENGCRSASRSPRGRLERNKSRVNDQSPVSKSESTTEAPTLKRSESRANIVLPPPMPPRPPPPPPSRNVLKDLPPLTEAQKKNLELLKSRPRRRPDWACMMKEVESGIKLRHVTCNDRSAPIIERAITKVADPTGDAHFVFDSEKSNVHNKLLKEIQSGVKLKSVKTNDRSKPILEGLRKFRRQLTIEEQMQKAEQAPVDEPIPDEMDDIDAVRDDLQSTKQMLALELRNKEALERENKRLQARVLNLEVELEREKANKGSELKDKSQQDQKLTESLKKEVDQARKDVERIEKQFAVVAEERDKARSELEEMKRAYASLEKRMKAGMALAGCPSAKDVARIATQKSVERAVQDSTEEEEEESSEEESEEDEDPKVAEEKRKQRELKMLKTKVKNIKHKTANTKKERIALKEQIKQQQKLLKEEKKKYKTLHKEVDKMAKLMAASSDDDDDEKDEEDEDDDEEETESEEESSSEESEDEEDSETDDEDLPIEKRKIKLDSRVKKHDNRLNVMKKGNYLLKAQVDRLKDDLAKQREEVATLQEDLDSVLAELG